MKSLFWAVTAALTLLASGAQAQTSFADLKRPADITDAESDAKMDEIDALLDQGMSMLVDAADPNNPGTVGDHAKAAQAVLLFEKALTISETWLGEGPYTSVVLGNVAFAYAVVGRNEEAIATYERAIRIWTILYGPEDDGLVINTSNLAHLYLDTGRLTEAEASFQAALHAAEKGGDNGRQMLPDILEGLAEVYDKAGRPVEAQAMRARAETAAN